MMVLHEGRESANYAILIRTWIAIVISLVVFIIRYDYGPYVKIRDCLFDNWIMQAARIFSTR